MWLKVDDAFLKHPKVHAAADCLDGRRPLGRVAAVWLECALYACSCLSDGFIPNRELDRLATDEKPREVVEALVSAGLAHREGAGVRFHDWLDHNPAADDVKAKKQRDKERKRRARGGASGPDVQPESARTNGGCPRGIAEDSERIPERSRARDPVPSRPHDQNRKPTGATAPAVASTRVA